MGGSGAYSYVYDAEGRITTVVVGGGGTPVSSYGYIYDGLGERVQKVACPGGANPCTPSVAGATWTTYVYDASQNVAPQRLSVYTTCWLQMKALDR